MIEKKLVQIPCTNCGGPAYRDERYINQRKTQVGKWNVYCKPSCQMAYQRRSNALWTNTPSKPERVRNVLKSVVKEAT